MNLEVVNLPPRRYAYLRHRGPYPEIGSTFGKMAALANEAGLLGNADALFVGVYHDDPTGVSPEALRSDAGVTLTEDAASPNGLEMATLEGGRYARGIHKGSYATMVDGWAATYAGIQANRLTVRALPPFEIYLSDMEKTHERELITEIYIPVE